MQLNPEQESAVEHVDGPCLVVAPPGSGKTRVLTSRVPRLVAKGVDGRRIMSITFTNRAANEMKERLEGTPCGYIGTFHAFCVKILRSFGSYLGYTTAFTIVDDSDQRDLIKQTARKLGITIEKGDVYTIAIAVNHYRESINETEDDLHQRLLEKDHLTDVALAYVESLLKSNMIDFSGLLSEAVRLLKSYPEALQKVERRFDYLMVDEVQDTNFAQMSLVELVAGLHNNIMLVGDHDQSIYAFRNARIENIQDFLNQHKDCKVINLLINYRSTPQIIEKATNLIKFNKNRLGGEIKTIKESGNNVICKCFLDQTQEAAGVARQIKSLLDNGANPNDIAIFYRINRLSEPIEQALSRESIPYEVIGGFSFYDRKEIKDCLAMLRFLVNPKDGVAFHRIADTIGSVGDTTIGKIETIAEQQNLSIAEACEEFVKTSKSVKIKKALEQMLNIFSRVHVNDPVGSVSSDLIDGFEYRDYLTKVYGNEAYDRIDNVMQLVDSAALWDTEGEKSIEKYLQNVSLMSNSDKSVKDKISLMSIHSSKGTEYTAVFVIGCENSILPHSLALMDDPVNGLEEERRIAFVAFSRAKNVLITTYCKRRSRFGKNRRLIYYNCEPSQFLYESEILKKKKKSVDSIYKEETGAYYDA